MKNRNNEKVFDEDGNLGYEVEDVNWNSIMIHFKNIFHVLIVLNGHLYEC